MAAAAIKPPRIPTGASVAIGPALSLSVSSLLAASAVVVGDSVALPLAEPVSADTEVEAVPLAVVSVAEPVASPLLQTTSSGRLSTWTEAQIFLAKSTVSFCS